MNYWAIFWILAPVAACMVLIFASNWVEKTGETLLENEPLCIPITNIQLEKMEELNGERKDGDD